MPRKKKKTTHSDKPQTVRKPGNKRCSKPLEKWRDRFLTAYANFPHIGKACKAAGISWDTYNKARLNNKEFRETIDRLYEGAVTKLEDEAFRRALDPKRKSDRLLTFMLVAHKPEKYSKESRIRRMEIVHGGQVSHSVTAKVDKQRLAQLAQDPAAAEALRVLAEREAALMLQEEQRADLVKALEDQSEKE